MLNFFSVLAGIFETYNIIKPSVALINSTLLNPIILAFCSVYFL